MRCPNCAGEIPTASRFCGICGRNITAPPGLAFTGAGGGTVQPDTLGADLSMSLFELPGARRARNTRVALVLAIDAILLGAGVVMILSYMDARSAKPVPGRPRVEVMAPTAPEAAAKPAPAPVPPPPEPTRASKRRGKAVPVVAPTPDAAPPEDPEVEDYADRVRLVVESHGAQLERCYERAAKATGPRDPLEGRIDLRFTLMPNGSAENVEVAGNTTGSEQLASCVADLFRAWSMPHGASHPIPLEWPVRFHPPAI
jgi:hypothetical protein